MFESKTLAAKESKAGLLRSGWSENGGGRRRTMMRRGERLFVLVSRVKGFVCRSVSVENVIDRGRKIAGVIVVIENLKNKSGCGRRDGV